jgi:hypothetical protein
VLKAFINIITIAVTPTFRVTSEGRSRPRRASKTVRIRTIIRLEPERMRAPGAAPPAGSPFFILNDLGGRWLGKSLLVGLAI